MEDLIPNFLQYLLVFSPIFALLLLLLPQFRKQVLYVLTGSMFGLAAYTFLFEPFSLINYTLSKVYALYPVFLGVSILVLMKFYEPNRSLGLSMILTYLSAEFHEIPAFIRMYLGLFDRVNALQEYFVWYSPMNHLYTVVVSWLFLRMGKVNMKNPWMWFLFVIGMIVDEVLYSLCAYAMNSPWEYIIRIVWLPILLLMLIVGRRKP